MGSAPYLPERYCLSKAAFLFTRLPLGSWMSDSGQRVLASVSLRAANHISSRRNTLFLMMLTSWEVNMSCAPFSLMPGSWKSMMMNLSSFGCSLGACSS